MKLIDLNPEFRNWEVAPEAVTPENCKGLEHDCPECARNGKPRHRVWVPLHDKSGHTWAKADDCSKVETFGYRPSVRMIDGICKGHWNLESGQIVFHGDSAP